MLNIFKLIGFCFLICNCLNGQTAALSALQTDGMDDFAYPLTPNAAGLMEGTVELWYSPDDWTVFLQIWGGGNGLPGVTGDWVKFGNHSSQGGEQIGFGRFAGAWWWASSGAKPQTGRWYHVAATWGANGTQLFVNGRLTGQSHLTGPMQNYSTELLASSAWSGFFAGSIDEVRIWNRQLDSLAIARNLLDTLSADYYTTADSGLVAYYRLDMLEDRGINADGADDLRDLSLNANHMDSEGDPGIVPSGAFMLTDISSSPVDIPETFILHQNYPNPFNPVTNVEFGIRNSEWVDLTVYDLLGREVRRLVHNRMDAGVHLVVWDGKNDAGHRVASGVYFYRLTVDKKFAQTRKMLLVR